MLAGRLQVSRQLGVYDVIDIRWQRGGEKITFRATFVTHNRWAESNAYKHYSQLMYCVLRSYWYREYACEKHCSDCLGLFETMLYKKWPPKATLAQHITIFKLRALQNFHCCNHIHHCLGEISLEPKNTSSFIRTCRAVLLLFCDEFDLVELANYLLQITFCCDRICQ